MIATSHLLWMLLATYLVQPMLVSCLLACLFVCLLVSLFYAPQVFSLLGLAHGPDTPHLQGLQGQIGRVVGEVRGHCQATGVREGGVLDFISEELQMHEDEYYSLSNTH